MEPQIPYFNLSTITLFGHVTVTGPGVTLVLGLLFGTWMAMRKARRDGLDANLIYRSLGWVVASVFIGGHIGDVLFYHPNVLITDPLAVLRIPGRRGLGLGQALVEHHGPFAAVRGDEVQIAVQQGMQVGFGLAGDRRLRQRVV